MAIVNIKISPFNNQLEEYVLDVFSSEDLSFEIVKQYFDVANLGTNVGDYTLSLKLPKTNRNINAFDNIGIELTDKSTFFRLQNYNARIEVDGIKVLDGTLFIDKISRDEYECTVLGENISWIQRIIDKPLKGLEMRTVRYSGSHTRDYEEPLFSSITDFRIPDMPLDTVPMWEVWPTNEEDNIYDFQVPLINYGNFGSISEVANPINPTVSIAESEGFQTAAIYDVNNLNQLGETRDFMLAPYLVTTIKRIFENAGFNVAGEFFELQIFKNIIIAYTGTDDYRELFSTSSIMSRGYWSTYGERLDENTYLNPNLSISNYPYPLSINCNSFTNAAPGGSGDGQIVRYGTFNFFYYNDRPVQIIYYDFLENKTPSNPYISGYVVSNMAYNILDVCFAARNENTIRSGVIANDNQPLFNRENYTEAAYVAGPYLRDQGGEMWDAGPQPDGEDRLISINNSYYLVPAKGTYQIELTGSIEYAIQKVISAGVSVNQARSGNSYLLITKNIRNPLQFFKSPKPTPAAAAPKEGPIPIQNLANYPNILYFQEIAPTTNTPNLTLSAARNTMQIVRENRTFNYNQFIDVELEKDDEIHLYFVTSVVTNGNMQKNTASEVMLYDYGGKTEIVAFDNFRFGAQRIDVPEELNPGIFLPDIKQDEFVKSVIKMFNLYVSFDRVTNTLTFDVNNQFSRQFNVATLTNWDDKCNIELDATIEPLTNNKFSNFQFTVDDDYAYDGTYANYTYESSSSYYLESSNVNVIFSPTGDRFVKFNNQKFDTLIPSMGTEDDYNTALQDVDDYNRDFSPRLLFWNGVTTFERPPELTDNQLINIGRVIVTSELNPNLDNRNSFLTGADFQLPIPSFTNGPNFSLTFNGDNGIFENFYREDVTNRERSMLITLPVMLTNLDFEDIDTRNPVVINGRIYYINLIDGYNPIVQGLTKCQLFPK